MGRTVPSVTQAFIQEQEAFSRFRRALRRSDQIALDDLYEVSEEVGMVTIVPIVRWSCRLGFPWRQVYWLSSEFTYKP